MASFYHKPKNELFGVGENEYLVKNEHFEILYILFKKVIELLRAKCYDECTKNELLNRIHKSEREYI